MNRTLQTEIDLLRARTDLRGLYEPIAYALEAGGKRLRPTLLLTCHALFAPTDERARRAALGIEMYHNHTLLHDDVMDNADVRRGRPTVHKKWNENTAILSGDAMLLRAAQIIETASPELIPLFLQTAMEVCEGQQQDVDFESRSDVTIGEYLEMIRLKTSVLLAAACRMGAMLAGASQEAQTALYDYGVNLGLAFQIMDDLLDTYGTEETFGKAIGGDILCGKKTWLAVKTASLLDGGERSAFLSLLGETPATSDAAAQKIEAVRRTYDTNRIPDLARDAIRHHSDAARHALDTLRLPEETLRPLLALLDRLAERTK